MGSLTEQETDEIELRALAATREPWHVEYLGAKGYPQRVANDAAVVVCETHDGSGKPAANAEFIAAARTDVLRLLAEVRRMRALPEMPEMVPNAAEEWQNGFRWGWYYAIKAVREGRP